MTEETVSLVPLDELAVVRVSGDDAAAFLQAQLSSDVRALEPGEARMTSWNTPAGKTVTSPRMLRSGPEEIFLVIPQGLAADVAAGLRRFVLRSRVTIDPPGALRVVGCTGPALPEGIVAHGLLDDGTGRTLAVVPAETVPPLVSGPAFSAWRESDLRSARPQVYAATSSRFVPQMLNLDLVGGISFDKGCYPGQEVVARARYLGRVKRRMALYAGTGQAMPEIGKPLAEQPNTAVIDACAYPGGWLALAVAPLTGASLPAGIQAVPLPYALPEASGEDQTT